MFVVFLHSSDPIPSKQYDAYMYFVDAVFGISYIYILKSKLWKLIVPNGKRLVVTGPDPHPIEVGVEVLPRAITHEDADIIMVYHMIEESVEGRSHI